MDTNLVQSEIVSIAASEGYLVKTPENDPIYLILDGRRRHVPNLDTLERLFKDGATIRVGHSWDNIPSDSPLSLDAELRTKAPVGEGSPIYLYNDNIYRWITDETVFNRYQFGWNKVKETIMVNVTFGINIY